MVASPNDARGPALTGSRGGGVIRLPSVGEGSENVSVAAVIVGGLGILYALRKGMRGIGDFQLTGSSVGAVEWLAYAMVVGGTLRVLQANYPDSQIVRAVAFAY